VNLKPYLHHLLVAFALMAVAAVFFSPNAFQNKVLFQNDNVQAQGIQSEIQQYLKQGEPAPLWTNSQFGGMPSFQIYVKPELDIIRPFMKLPFLFTDLSAVWAQVFAAMLMAYLLLTVLGARWPVALMGALGYGITSYNVDILEAGHSTKMAALALTPGLLACTVLTMRGKYLLGGGLLALLTAMQVYVNHLQITYYTLLLVGIYFLVSLVEMARNGQLMAWLKSAAVTAVAVGLGFATSAGKLWSTMEYAGETIRGKSELSAPTSAKGTPAKGDGLSFDYAYDWSCGKMESLTLLVPHFAGGGNNEKFKDTKLYKSVPADQRGSIGTAFYTGSQPFVGTAIYAGAIVLFLFLLGALCVRGTMKWWLLLGTLFMVSIAWGKYFYLNHLLFEYFPMYNKFRAVTMAFGLAQLGFVALGALGVQEFIGGTMSATERQRNLLIAAGVTIGVCLLTNVLAGSGANDSQFGDDMLRVIEADRSAMVWSDSMRSAIFVALAAGLLWLFHRGSLQATWAVLAIAGLSLADNWTVATRTIGPEKYVSQRNNGAPAMKAYDKQIKADKDIHFRVLDLARGGIAGNGSTSYFHKSISGYHAAKLQRFQQVLERYLSGENLGKSLHILGMMNTKYLVTPQEELVPNPEACGHAWFVKHWMEVPDGDAELAALKDLNPRDTAVIQTAFVTALKGFSPQRDSAAQIKLTDYHPDRMTYQYSAATDQLAVFPEQYYPPAKGWKCYLNGQPYDDFVKANFLIRALKVPAGQHMKLEMRFEPKSYILGSTIGWITALLCVAAAAGGVFLAVRKGLAKSAA
jgi:hypothetical protein